jgi:hypothetical protein
MDFRDVQSVPSPLAVEGHDKGGKSVNHPHPVEYQFLVPADALVFGLFHGANLNPLLSRERNLKSFVLRMKRLQSTILAFLTLAISVTAAEAEKIRTAIPQANLNYLSIHVTDAKGYFRDGGLDNETVVISGPWSIAALLSGDVDYSGAGGSGMRAALKGAPIKGIMFQADKVTFYLVG